MLSQFVYINRKVPKTTASCKEERSIFWKHLPLRTVFFSSMKLTKTNFRSKLEKPTEDSTINAQCRY